MLDTVGATSLLNSSGSIVVVVELGETFGSISTKTNTFQLPTVCAPLNYARHQRSVPVKDI